MTNKKFKLAAMSLALTACVAASPLAANAETGAEATSSTPAVETPAPTAEPSGENAPTTNETKQESTDESKQESTDESKKESTDEAKPEVAVENKALAEAPAAKAPVLMTAALAPAPAAPTTPMEEDTVATITRQDGTTTTTTKYTSFDEAVSKANDGDTIEVIKDATSTGIDLQNKKLTIKGTAQTVTTTTDSGTEEKTTVKPKLKFVAKEGQSQIAGITLWGSDLTFQNMDVNMKGAGSTTYNDWNTVCMSDNASLTLNRTNLSMDGTGLDASAQGIYMAGRGRSVLNVDNHSTLTINNYYNAIAWDGVGKGNEGSTYFINITDGSTFKAEGNGAGIVGLESLDVLVDHSTLTITDCTERSGINGADVKIVNGSTANISGNHEGYGIHANDLLVENSTLTANNNGYGGIRITGKGEFTNSTVTVTGTENKGNASVEITVNKNEHKDKDKYLVGSLSVQNSTLNISDNNATGIACRNRFSCPTSLTIDDASRVTIQNNNATPKNGYNPKGDSTGGGLRIEEGSTAVLGRNTVINNNTAKSGGGVYTKGGKVTINSSTITENKATGNGGGICAEDNSTVTVVGGEISSNEAAGTNRTTSGGGGIFANKGSTVKLNDTTVSENKVTGDYGSGGGVRVDGGKLTVDNAKILDNATNNNGGGISVKDSELSVTDSQITGNNAWNKVTVGERIFVNGNGGGIEIIGSDSDTKEYTITNTQITQNTTGLRGGGIYAEKASLTITKSTLDGNKALDTVGPQASSEGGGLSVRGGTNITLDSTTVTNNSAKDGGGIWVRSDVDTSVSIKNGTTINNNQSVYGGGGVMIRQELGKKIDVTIEDAKIETNAAENGGGIYLLNQVDLKLKNITVSGNTAKNVGGGIFGQDGTKLHADNLTVSNNTAASGGGVYLWNTGNSIILAELLNSFIDHNTVSGSGGGIFAYNGVQINANNTSISNNKSKSGGAIWMNASDAELTGNTITHNTATGNGGGIYGEQRSTIGLRTGALYNNHAGTAGDDMYLNNTTLILRPVGDDWILDDCGHPIDGWYLDGKDARWDADSQKKFVTNLDALLEGTDYMIEKGEDGCYIITIGSNALALKAAHNAPSEPKPDPDGPDTPNPKPNPKPEPKPGPDTPVTPEDPQLPPVQDARADTPDSPVLPSSPTNPAVQDAHALPQTGTSLFAALAMALSGFALTIAGAWASLLGKNSRH